MDSYELLTPAHGVSHTVHGDDLRSSGRDGARDGVHGEHAVGEASLQRGWGVGGVEAEWVAESELFHQSLKRGLSPQALSGPQRSSTGREGLGGFGGLGGRALSELPSMNIASNQSRLSWGLRESKYSLSHNTYVGGNPPAEGCRWSNG